MIRKILFLLLSLACFAVHPKTATKMSKYDRLYKRDHLKTLGDKKGYQGNKDWAKFIEMAIRYEDKEVLEALLRKQPKAKVLYHQYVLDIYSIFKVKPKFFVSTAFEVFDKNMACVARLFKGKEYIINKKEYDKVFKSLPNDKLMDTFSKVSSSLPTKKDQVLLEHTKCQKALMN